jgi:hypothetical protein
VNIDPMLLKIAFCEIHITLPFDAAGREAISCAPNMKYGAWVNVLDVEEVHLDVGVESAREIGRRYLAARMRPTCQVT